MIYLIRAVKYFFYFAIITTLMICALVFIGAVEGDINAIFNGGYSSLWKIALFFVLVAAVYPKVGFIRRRLYIDDEWNQVRNAAVNYFSERRYIVESETDNTISFRCRDIASKISKMYEDRVVLSKTEEGFFLEGLRKDVIRLAAGLEHRLGPDKAE